MKHNYLLLLGLVLLFGATCVQAQVRSAPSPIITIQEKKSASFPKPWPISEAWKLRWSCVAAAGEDGKPIWLLAFTRKVPVPSDSFFNDSLDTTVVVAKSIAPAKGRSHWHVLRQIPLGFRRENAALDFQLRWLKPTEKVGPILLVPDNGMQQVELLAFPEGWQQVAAIRQRCQNAMNPIQGFDFSFDDVDETGTFAVTLNITDYGDGYSTPSGSRLIRWNGKGWGKEGETQ